MIKPAFSTVACPEWTLEEVAASAGRYGYEGVELRTFGERGARLACDPALTSEDKVLGMFRAVGVEVLSLGTSVSFEEVVNPPVIGLAISDTERTVREAKRAVDMAVALECPYIRVFGFEAPGREKLKTTVERITKRLRMVVDHAEKTGVRIVIENGGSFSRAAEVAELAAGLGSPLVGVSYSMAVGLKAGDEVGTAVGALGSRLWVAKIKDLDGSGAPKMLGQGRLPCKQFVQALVENGFDGPLVFEWDRLWFPALARASEVLPAAALQMFQWVGECTGKGMASGARSAAANGGAGAGSGRGGVASMGGR